MGSFLYYLLFLLESKYTPRVDKKAPITNHANTLTNQYTIIEGGEEVISLTSE
jgi:hypothetical protein